MTPWWAVDVHVARKQRAPDVAEWLVGRTGQALEDRGDGSLVASLEAESPDSLLDELRSAFGNEIDAISVRSVPLTDWSTSWREGLGPRTVGRLSLVPSWTEPESFPEGLTLILDPESAFGSGEHGSTRAAWTLLDRHLKPGDTVLDLGTGSGILALAAARLGARRAVGIEIDSDALPVAERNARRNALGHLVSFVEGDAGSLAPLLGPADIVLSNILRLANVALLPAINESLAPGATVIFSGMEQEEAELFLPELEAHGHRVVDETVDQGWWAVATAC